MDWISKEFLLAVCGSLLIALIAIAVTVPLVQRPPPQPAESSQRAAEANHGGNSFDYARLGSYIDLAASYCTSESPNPQYEWGKKFICESKITDAVIAFLTFFLAIFTGLLVRVGNRQERTTRQQMRAFVHLDRGSIYNIATPINPLPSYKPTGAEILSRTDGPVAQMTIKNTGSTPAFKVVHWAWICVEAFPLKGNLPPRMTKGLRMPTSSIPPGGINTKNPKMATPLTAEEIQALRDGTKAIYVYGEIDYVDAFRRKRRTIYRLFHNNQTGNIGVTTDLTWAEDGNDAD